MAYKAYSRQRYTDLSETQTPPPKKLVAGLRVFMAKPYLERQIREYYCGTMIVLPLITICFARIGLLVLRLGGAIASASANLCWALLVGDGSSVSAVVLSGAACPVGILLRLLLVVLCELSVVLRAGEFF